MVKETTLTFGELKLIQSTAEDVLMLVSKNDALRISMNYDGSVLEVLNLWTEKLMKVYSKQFYSEDWQKLSDRFRNGYRALVAATEDDESMLIVLISFLNGCLDFLKSVESILPNLHSKCVGIILHFLLDIVLDSFKIYKKRWKNAQKVFLKHIQSLHHACLQLLSKSTNNFIIDDDQQFSTLTEIVLTLTMIAEYIASEEIKIIMETWKCIVKLSVHCIKCSHKNNSKYSLEWSKKPLKQLLQIINRNVDNVLNKEILSQPIEVVERYLRVSGYNVKFVHLLAAELKHDGFSAGKLYMEIYQKLHDLPEHLLHSRILPMIEIFLMREFQDVFKVIYRNQEVSNFLQHQKPNISYGFVKDYVGLAIDERDCEFINANFLTYKFMFEKIMKDRSVFFVATKYDGLIEMFAALTILGKKSRLQKYFMENVLKENNFYVMFASLDILLIATRYYQRHKKLYDALSEFQYWLRRFEAFAVFSNSARRLLVQRLLRHHFRVCKSTPDVCGNTIWQSYTQWPVTIRCYKLYLAVGLRQLDGISPQQLRDELQRQMNDFSKNSSAEEFYKVVFYIKLMAMSPASPAKDFLQYILEFATQLCTNHEFTSHQTAVFFNSICELIERFVHNVDSGYLHRFLDVISEDNHFFKRHISIQLVSLLNSCTRHPDERVRCSSENCVKHMRVTKNSARLVTILLDSVLEKLEGTEINYELYKKISCSDLHARVCRKTPQPQLATSSGAVKRLRKDDVDLNSSDHKLLLVDILEKTNLILRNSVNLDSDDVRTIETITNNLRNAIDQKR